MTDAANKRWRDRAIARLQKRWNMGEPVRVTSRKRA
jgi:hypothetical protein